MEFSFDVDRAAEAYLEGQWKTVGKVGDFNLVYRPAGVVAPRHEIQCYKDYLPDYANAEITQMMHGLRVDTDHEQTLAVGSFHITPDNEASLGLVAVHENFRRRQIASFLTRCGIELITEICSDQAGGVEATPPANLEIPEAFLHRINSLLT